MRLRLLKVLKQKIRRLPEIHLMPFTLKAYYITIKTDLHKIYAINNFSQNPAMYSGIFARSE